MKPRERQIQRVAWTLIAVAVAIYIARLAPRGPSLADRSTRIADAVTWDREYPGYFWETDHSVIAVSATELAFMRLDLTTGSTTPLTTFSQRVAQTQPDSTNWRLSPDGKWFLVECRPTHRVTALSVDGNKTANWQVSANAMRFIHWMPNSKEWVELRGRKAQGFGSFGLGAILPVQPRPIQPGLIQPRDVQSPPKTEFVQPVVHSLGGQYRNAPTIHGPCSFPISTTADNHLITAEDRGDHIDVIRYDLTAKNSQPISASFVMQSGFGGFEAEASHKGDRIAFITHARVRPSFTSALGFLFPSLKDSGERTIIWLANTDGTGLHQVGVQHGQTVAGVQWTPDDSHLSYFIGNSLYTIPAK
jgi:hypothetical protein